MPTKQFLFVDGPSLGRGDSKYRSTRSALIRRRISERRSIYRQEEEAKRQELVTQRQGLDWYLATRWCACRGRARDQAQPQGARNRPVVSQTQSRDGISMCGTCGVFRTCHQPQGGALSLSHVTGRADPFSSVDPSLGPGVDDLLQHAVTSIWPNFRQADYAGRCYQSWAAPTRENKLVIYSTLWAASCHRDVLRISYGSNPVLDIQDQLYYKGRILKLLREHVTDFTKEEWRDGIIMAILYLAVNETSRRDLSRDPSPFTPPFVDMQSLSFYGSRNYHTLHWNVICDLLRQLGGIQSLKLFALGWLTSIADLMNAAHSLTKPHFPMVDVEGNGANFSPPSRVSSLPGDLSETTKLGFRDLLSSSRPPVKEGIVDVFLLLSQYSTLVQWSYNEPLEPSNYDRFADFRNHVHHTLFSLPDEHDPVETVLDICGLFPDDFSVSHELYLTCRLAANLYATHVTFPIPRSAQLRAMILQLLTSKLGQLIQFMSSPLLLWCATVAAIAGEELAEYSRLTEYVNGLCQELKVTSYLSFVEILQSFAWVEVACSEGCHRLWGKLAVTGGDERVEVYTGDAV